jgi:hypothetical protein
MLRDRWLAALLAGDASRIRRRHGWPSPCRCRFTLDGASFTALFRAAGPGALNTGFRA